MFTFVYFSNFGVGVMDDFDEFSMLKKLNRQEFLHILISLPGADKELVVEQCLLRPLDKLCSMPILREHRCVRVQQLPMEANLVAPSASIAEGADQQWHIDWRVFFVRPTIAIARRICELIRANPNYSYAIIMVCSQTRHFLERQLETNGLFGAVRLFEFDLTFIQLESDLFSLELPQYSPDLFERYFGPLAKALWKLQILYGQINTIFGLGPSYVAIDRQLKRFCRDLGEPSASADQPISHVFLFDRRLDLASVLLTSPTYESILNDIFQYKCGKITFQPTANGEDKANCAKICGQSATDKNETKEFGGVFALSNADPIFSAIRNSHMTAVYPFLSSKTKMLKTSFSKVSEIQNVEEMKSFVSSELRNLKDQQKQLELHIFACEHIRDKMKNGINKERLAIEEAIMRGQYEDSDVAALIARLISAKHDHWSVLQLACLWSLHAQGLPPKLYRQFQEAYLHRYGFPKLVNLYKLRQHGLLTERAQSVMGAAAVVQHLPKTLLGAKTAIGKQSSTSSRIGTPPTRGTSTFSSPILNGAVSGLGPSASTGTENCLSSMPTLSSLLSALQLCPRQIDEAQQNANNRGSRPASAAASSETADDRNSEEERRRSLAYVFSDAYIPLVAHIVHGTVTHGWQEVRLKKLFGDHAVHCSNPGAAPPDNRLRRAILVCFVGGVTHAEIAVLRRFALNHNFRLIVLTTHIVCRTQFLRSYTDLFF